MEHADQNARVIARRCSRRSAHDGLAGARAKLSERWNRTHNQGPQSSSLKNRTAHPQAADFDSRVTLDALLQPGHDTNRWSTDRAARIQGEVIVVAYAGTEAANCFGPSRRDIHINIATRKGAAQNEQVVLEVTPHLRDWARERGMDWSAETLHAQLVGRWCEFEGWLYYDVGHDEDSENTAPNKPDNWRATAWEIHPITKITVIR